MSKRRRTAIAGPPLTVAEVSGTSKELPTQQVITCSKCDKPGGTLVKVEDGRYIHQVGSGCNI